MSRFRNERTFVMMKPDGVQKGLVGELLTRFERRDLKIVALEMFTATRDEVNEHYPKDETWIRRLGEKTLSTYAKYNLDAGEELGTSDPLEIGKLVRNWLLDYLTMAPMVRMVVEGIHSVDVVRKIVGNTIPSIADMGTFRGDFSNDSPAVANTEKRGIMNLVHASENTAEAEHEITYWFGDKNVFTYKRFGVDS